MKYNASDRSAIKKAHRALLIGADVDLVTYVARRGSDLTSHVVDWRKEAIALNGMVGIDTDRAALVPTVPGYQTMYVQPDGSYQTFAFNGERVNTVSLPMLLSRSGSVDYLYLDCGSWIYQVLNSTPIELLEQVKTFRLVYYGDFWQTDLQSLVERYNLTICQDRHHVYSCLGQRKP